VTHAEAGERFRATRWATVDLESDYRAGYYPSLKATDAYAPLMAIVPNCLSGNPR